MRYIELKPNFSGNIITKIKKAFFWYIVRPFMEPEDFFYFTTKNKTNDKIVGKHWAGGIRIYRNMFESPKDWERFCFFLIYNSRKNRHNA